MKNMQKKGEKLVPHVKVEIYMTHGSDFVDKWIYQKIFN